MSASRPKFSPLPLVRALKTAGWGEIQEKHASGDDRALPAVARSLTHLLEVIERLEGRGAFFQSIRDPFGTASPHGKFTLQVLGAAAMLERARLPERTRAG